MSPNPNPQIRRRSSLRLQGYDYRLAGAYFVTIVTYHRQNLFGKVVDGEMQLNELGKIVQDTWEGLPGHYACVGLSSFCIMPNHVHGIIMLFEDDCVGAGLRPAPITNDNSRQI